MFRFGNAINQPRWRRCVWIAACFAAACAFGQPAAAQAQSQAASYPSKPINFVIPNEPGSGPDILMRRLGLRLQEKWAQTVVPSNKPGASQIIASEFVAKAAPDGYTLLLGTMQSHGANSGLFRKLPYDPIKDFVPISLLVTAPFVLVVHPSVPAKNMRELLELAHAKSGSLNYGSQGNGSLGHIGMAVLEHMGNVHMNHIPYKGSPPARQDLLGGRIDALMSTIFLHLGDIRAGKARALGVTSLQRNLLLPDVPTISEAGLSGYEMIGWFGIFAPAGTSRDIAMKLNTEIVRIMNEPDMKNPLTEQGMVVVAGSADELAQLVAREIAKYIKIIREANIEPT